LRSTKKKTREENRDVPGRKRISSYPEKEHMAKVTHGGEVLMTQKKGRICEVLGQHDKGDFTHSNY